jgi:LacI family transcriptional regulator
VRTILSSEDDVVRAGRVTILDVAHAAGVQPSTVSKALNDGRGSPDVRRRVADAAARLGYRPNQRARGLRRSESHSIGVLVPDLANPVYLPFLRGVEQAAQERNYVVLIADGQGTHDPTTAALERFFDQGIDGLVLGGAVEPSALRLYLEHGVPVAPSLADGGRDIRRHWGQGEREATAVMGRRLVELGHRRITFVGTPLPPGTQGRRYRESRLDALAGTLESTDAELIVAVVDPKEGFEGCRSRLVDAVTDRAPTAIVCGNHLVAPWLLIAIDDADLAIPRDRSVVVYGDSDWARAYRPSLSVVRRDAYAEGYDLTASMLEEIAGSDGPRRGTIDARFVERESVGHPEGHSAE